MKIARPIIRLLVLIALAGATVACSNHNEDDKSSDQTHGHSHD